MHNYIAIISTDDQTMDTKRISVHCHNCRLYILGVLLGQLLELIAHFPRLQLLLKKVVGVKSLFELWRPFNPSAVNCFVVAPLWGCGWDSFNVMRIIYGIQIEW